MELSIWAGNSRTYNKTFAIWCYSAFCVLRCVQISVTDLVASDNILKQLDNGGSNSVPPIPADVQEIMHQHKPGDDVLLRPHQETGKAKC